jgi:putative endopeptidase
MTSRSLTLLACTAALACGAVRAQAPGEGPLTTLPYTPSLDIPSMDKSVDPCEDFYRYSCEGWIKNNPIPPDQARWDVYGKLTHENQRLLWGLLEQASKPDAARTKVQQETGDYFAACMDEASIEKAGSKPLKPVLDEIAGLKSLKELTALVSREHLQLQGNGMMFGFGSNQDFENSNSIIAFAFAGGLGLPDRDYYTKTDPKSVEIRAKYLEHVRNMLQLIGDDAKTAEAESNTIMAIETALAKVSLTRVEQRDPHNLFHKVKAAQFKAMAPSLDWDRYFAIQGLPALAELNVTEPRFFAELQKQLVARPLADWKTYLRWHLLHAKAPYLASQFVQANFDFYSKYLHGVAEMPPRWRRCVQYVDRDLGEALGQVFVEKTFSPEAKQRALSMTNEIEAAMERDLKDLPWMSDSTKKQAFEKLHGIVNKIGYPDRWRDYSSIRIDRSEFLGNVDRATTFESRRQIAKIGKPVDRGEWQMTPPTVNAYYDPQMNDINFPAGVLQPPLFDVKMDAAPNYGNTGATIGHELTHGFDDEGRQFDAKGNLRDWWTAEDAKRFDARAQCVVDQYREYTVVDDIKINGKLTLGENIADIGGTLLAYMAWKHATADQNLKPVDGFTPDQRFFIGMAQWACGSERPENKRAGAITNPHSPDEYRINGVVANMPEFAEAFSCKTGQPMVRAKACRVW